ncbi:MAG: hypothetical protein UT41_C0001G0232 [Candidatus Wolfebacteria bacterium GW2011_GWC2_39_22]|uniref:Uncharacterized protein n=1 Tax=Candidatus Wolfebacteria bacterium GW2011_GWC2_39_22 TaxID=1619013 RepID=A0A0G0NB54_9BACT|nr:MAG: hypothetical protein UT41_C0001G0232 [Candidatus Wolfebacteria bacterium GW2011_GWC2_39_22]HBI25648.1 hypothetical protein [Candidatus Wolfebacteria bacterium]
MFQVIVAMITVGTECATFQEAFRRFHAEVTKMVVKGTSRQVLETACFIRYVFTSEGEELNTQLYFYACCDLAHEIGLLSDDGELEELAIAPSVERIQAVFYRSTVIEVSATLKMADRIQKSVLTLPEVPMTKAPRLTFKPLRNGKFRCNQTNEIVGRGQTKAYRLREEKKLLRKFNEKHNRPVAPPTTRQYSAGLRRR